MRKPLLGAAAITVLALVLPLAVPALAATPTRTTSSSGRSAAAVAPVLPVNEWLTGVRAGTTKITSEPGATCKPKIGTTAADRRCKLTFSGRFTGTDKGYHGTYSGTAYIRYLDPATSNYAAWDAGTVTYVVRGPNNAVLATLHLAIDLGTGGVFGYPYDLSLAYAIEERDDMDSIVLRMSGTGVNQLDANLNPIRTFIDRIGYQNGI
jgi:hypothetical protein